MELGKENQSDDFSSELEEAETLKNVMKSLQEAKEKLTEVVLQETSVVNCS